MQTMDGEPANRKLLWLTTTFVAALTTAGLIGLSFVTAPPMPAASAAIPVKDTANITPPGDGPPLFTGSIQIETVEVVAASLRGALYDSKGPAPSLRPSSMPMIYSTALTPLPVAGMALKPAMGTPAGGRHRTDKPSIIGAEPLRLASLTPQLQGGATNLSTRLEPQPKNHTFIVAPGETLGAILDRYRLNTQDRLALIKALRTVFAPRNLRAGQEVTLTVVKGGEEAVMPLSLTFGTDMGDVAVNRKTDGSYEGAVDGKQAGTATHYRAISRIQSSLYGAARAQKVPDSIIVRMMNTHSYDVDFQREIHPGDTFEVFYARGRTQDLQPRGRGTLLFSSLTTGGRKRSYYRFTSRDGETDYYDDKGISSKKPLMRTPIDGARISSGFGMRRHPILGYSKMHTGTDFAAPSGTPILAAGDGRVDFAARKGGYGNYVRLKHDNGVKTAYAHMKRFARGLKKGKRVRQGQVIGFVGTTGRSTGPHLHYEVLVNGKKRNPLKVKIAGGGRKLRGKDKKAFNTEKARIDRLRREVPVTTLVAAKS